MKGRVNIGAQAELHQEAPRGAKVSSLSPKHWGSSGEFEIGSERGRASLRALSGSHVEVDQRGWGQEGCRPRNQSGDSPI